VRADAFFSEPKGGVSQVSGRSRILGVLDLFTPARPVWGTDEIIAALGCSRPTGYRCIKDLMAAGLLQKTSAGNYALGARIIQLDFQIRQSDPVLLASMPVMTELATESGLSAVLSAMFGQQVIDIHRASRADDTLHLRYGRGRSRPLFQGAAPKVILAFLPRANLLRIYRTFSREIELHGMGRSWPEFRRYLSAVRREGFYLSRGELEASIGAGAVPVLNSDGDVLAALALVGSIADIDRIGAPLLKTWLQDAANGIRADVVDAARTTTSA
jgi:DNA-binding IclR family transcriptional regulator